MDPPLNQDNIYSHGEAMLGAYHAPSTSARFELPSPESEPVLSRNFTGQGIMQHGQQGERSQF